MKRKTTSDDSWFMVFQVLSHNTVSLRESWRVSASRRVIWPSFFLFINCVFVFRFLGCQRRKLRPSDWTQMLNSSMEHQPPENQEWKWKENMMIDTSQTLQRPLSNKRRNRHETNCCRPSLTQIIFTSTTYFRLYFKQDDKTFFIHLYYLRWCWSKEKILEGPLPDASLFWKKFIWFSAEYEYEFR